jgi:hypothetical protein
MVGYNEWVGNPNDVDVIQYIDGLLRAASQAGLTVTTAHISTIKAMIERQYLESQSFEPVDSYQALD